MLQGSWTLELVHVPLVFFIGGVTLFLKLFFYTKLGFLYLLSYSDTSLQYLSNYKKISIFLLYLLFDSRPI